MGLAEAILGFISQANQRELAQDEWKLKKQQLQMAIDERDKRVQMIESLPDNLKQLAYIHPEGAAKILGMNALIDNIAGVQQTNLNPAQDFETRMATQPTPPPSSVEQTGEMFRPTNEMVNTYQQYQAPKLQGLPQQIAASLVPGMTRQDMVRDYIQKETGIGTSVEPVRTEPQYNQQTKQMQMYQTLRNGTGRWLNDPSGKPLIVPDEVTWQDQVIGNQVVKVGYNKRGEVIQQNGMPLIQMNVPQNQQLIRGLNIGPTGQGAITMPPGGLPPGTVLPEAVKNEPLTLTGPQEETSTIYVNPYNLNPATAGKGTAPSTGPIPGLGGGPPTLPGIPTKPPQPASLDIAGRISLMKGAIDALGQLRDTIFDKNTGEVKHWNLMAGALGIPKTEGRNIQDTMFKAVDPIIRAASAGQVNPAKIQEYINAYAPSVKDTDQEIRNKWQALGSFLQSFSGMLDPNKIYTKDMQQKFSDAMNVKTPGKGKTNKYQKLSDQELLQQLGGQ